MFSTVSRGTVRLRSRMYASSAPAAALALRRSPVDEIVEDSEPERAQARKEERRKRREEKSRKQSEESLVSWANKGIPSFAERKNSRSVIREAEVQQQPPVFLSPLAPSPPPEDVVEHDPPLLDSPERAPTLNLAQYAYSSLSLNSRPPSRASSSGFTSASASTLPTTVSKTPSVAPSIDLNAEPRPFRSKHKKKRTLPAVFDIYTEAQLVLLTKCVACDVSWTARKTASAKVEHMSICCRKNVLEEVEIQSRVDKELENIEAQPISKKKGKGKGGSKAPASILEPTRPNTFLEDFVEVAAPKKRTKRKEVVGTVQPVPEAQAIILERARLLLEKPIAESVDRIDSQPRASILANADENQFPPPTQAFGSSNLASGFRKPAGSAIGFQMDYDDLNQELPPLTQNFAPSKLSALHRPTVKSALSFFDPSDDDQRNQQVPLSTSPRCLNDPHRPRTSSPIMISSDDESISPKQSSSKMPLLDPPDSPNLLTRTTSRIHDHSVAKLTSAIQALTHSPPSTLMGYFDDEEVLTKVDDGAEHYAAIQDEWGDEGACLIWNDGPGVDVWDHKKVGKQRLEEVLAFFDQDSSDAVQEAVKKIGSVMEWVSDVEQRQPPEDEGLDGISPTSKTTRRRSKTPVTSKKKASKSKTKTNIRTKDTALDGVEVFKAFKNMILEYEELHLRVLRYEPISFDELVAEAEKKGIKTVALKQKLKTFLDASCISFYGSNGDRNR